MKRTTTPTARSAVIYARVSSKEQEQGYSIDAQLGLLREYSAREGIKVLKEFVEGESAKRAGRRAFTDMLALVRSSGCQAIVVEKTDRLYRNLKDRVLVDDLGVEIHLVKEGEILTRDSKSHQKFIHDIKLLVAKNYIDNLSEETKKGMAEKARQGIYPTKAPLGYLNVERGGRRVIEVDPVRGPLVRRLFEVYGKNRHSFRHLAALAFDLGLRSKKGHRVAISALAFTLQNPVFCGIVEWNGEKYAGAHEPLVPRNLFERCQDIMHGRVRNNSGYGVKDFAYRGLFRCGQCGCTMTAEMKKGKYIYYHCTGGRGGCAKPHVREEVLTDQFAELLGKLAIGPDLLALLLEVLEESRAEHDLFLEVQVARLEREEARLRARLEQLYLDKVSGELGTETYRSLRSKTEDELASMGLAKERFTSKASSSSLDAPKLLELAATAHIRFKEASNDSKREMLSALCSNCIYVGPQIHVELKEPFNLMLNAPKQLSSAGTRGTILEEWLPD